MYSIGISLAVTGVGRRKSCGFAVAADTSLITWPVGAPKTPILVGARGRKRQLKLALQEHLSGGS